MILLFPEILKIISRFPAYTQKTLQVSPVDTKYFYDLFYGALSVSEYVASMVRISTEWLSRKD